MVLYLLLEFFRKYFRCPSSFGKVISRYSTDDFLDLGLLGLDLVPSTPELAGYLSGTCLVAGSIPLPFFSMTGEKVTNTEPASSD
jgi:hypothetical protein